jgi:hypothetical protein
MSFLDKAKAKLTQAVDQHGEKITGGIDKAARMANEKTGGKHADKIEKATSKAREALDALDGKNDDIPDADTRPAPGTNSPDPTAQPGPPTDPSNPATG